MRVHGWMYAWTYSYVPLHLHLRLYLNLHLHFMHICTAAFVCYVHTYIICYMLMYTGEDVRGAIRVSAIKYKCEYIHAYTSNTCIVCYTYIYPHTYIHVHTGRGVQGAIRVSSVFIIPR